MATDEREKIINKFIVRIFRGRSKGLSKQAMEISLKNFLRKNGKKWTAKIEMLFETTWKKKIPEDILKKFKQESLLEGKPSKRATSLKIDVDKLPKRKYVSEKTQEPDDIDNPIYDEPEFKVKTRIRTCAKCGSTFTQNQEYPNRLLCPECNASAVKYFSYNNVYASDALEYKSSILNIKPL